MKKIVTALLFLSPVAGAAESVPDVEPPLEQPYYQPEKIGGLHTLTLGFADSHIRHFKNLKGVNAKYRYEIPDLPLSAMVSFTAMSTRGSQSFDEGAVVKNHRVRYYSLMVGPALRVTPWASLYFLGGPGWESSTNKTNYYHSEKGDWSGRYKISHARFAWGTGVQLNLIDNLAVDVGYQAGRVQKTSSNGFNIGVGYRF